MSDIRARSATLICMALFLAQPVQFGIWLSRIAEVQSALDMSNSTLAFALLGMPIGLLPTLYFAGGIVDRFGVRASLLWAFPAMLLAGTFPGLAGSPVSLFLGLLVLGACFAFTEVGLNVSAARTEKHFRITIMNRAHGFWSLGVMLGSLTGVLLSRLELTAFPSLAIAGCVMLPISIAITMRLPDYKVEEEGADNDAGPWRLPSGLVAIIVIVFGATLTEGAMSDWATVYMREAHWGGTARDGLAVSVFSGMVTLGRFFGDSVNIRFGATTLARACLGLAVAGITVLVVSNSIWVSFLGFGLVGLGVSSIFPLGISATAQLSPRNQARNVSVMTFGALSGFLIGPLLIGLVSDQAGLRFALCLLIPALALSLAMAARLEMKAD